MSGIQSRVGRWSFHWKTIPRGREGVAQVGVKSNDEERLPERFIEVRWKKDQDGIWIQLPHGLFGYDLQGELDENSQIQYRVGHRGFDSEWIGLTATSGNEAPQTNKQGGKAKPARIRAQMPSKIIRILVEEKQEVQKGQPIIVMEAMKMENEIRAPQAGKISQIKVTSGQAVETGADLILLENQ